MKTWIIIGSASEAHWYTYDHKKFQNGNLKLELMASYENPSNHKKEDDLVTGRSGSYQAQNAHGSFAPASDPKEVEADRFAKHMADLLNTARLEQKFDKLVLIFPPHFYGLFNKHVKKEILPLVYVVIQKDYTQLPIKELETDLAPQLP
jgi:protein required for attachment to host cells